MANGGVGNKVKYNNYIIIALPHQGISCLLNREEKRKGVTKIEICEIFG